MAGYFKNCIGLKVIETKWKTRFGSLKNYICRNIPVKTIFYKTCTCHTGECF